MGMGIANAQLRAGLDAVGFDVSADAMAHFVDQGGRVAPSAADAAEGADIVVSVVVSGAQTETMLFGSGGIADVMKAGAVFISCATMDPSLARSLAARLEARHVHYLDAPISGGAARAEAGALTVMASGSSEAFARARPVLGAMAATVHELGDAAGIGASFKMINQLLAGIHIVAASEAIALASKLGLDLDKVYEVITASAGNSWMFENRIPHVLSGDYAPHSAVEIFVKDLGIVQDMARGERYPAPLSAAALQMYLAASGLGMGREDDASLARVYALLSGAVLPTKES
ncbi:L-threonate dehydrogenase [Kaistia algarum]|uniref:L-threonate dehydrogenase n=1 Tax=Kaistia algarum TaxID=2083279 RepID=UPI00389925A5